MLYDLFDKLLKELENYTHNREKCDELLKHIEKQITHVKDIEIDIIQLKELFNMYENCYEENTKKSNLRILTSQQVSYHDKPITLQVKHYTDNIIKKLYKPLDDIFNVVFLVERTFYTKMMEATYAHFSIIAFELQKIKNLIPQRYEKMEHKYIIEQIAEMKNTFTPLFEIHEKNKEQLIVENLLKMYKIYNRTTNIKNNMIFVGTDNDKIQSIYKYLEEYKTYEHKYDNNEKYIDDFLFVESNSQLNNPPTSNNPNTGLFGMMKSFFSVKKQQE